MGFRLIWATTTGILGQFGREGHLNLPAGIRGLFGLQSKAKHSSGGWPHTRLRPGGPRNLGNTKARISVFYEVGVFYYPLSPPTSCSPCLSSSTPSAMPWISMTPSGGGMT